jgi:hypothetical protein
MKPEQIIKIQLVTGRGEPLRLDKVFSSVRLFTKGNYCYGFRLNSTDENGQLIIRYDDIEKARKSSAQESIMDYNTPLKDCDDEIGIQIPEAQDLEKAYEIAKRWAGKGVASPEMEAWLTANNAKIKAEEVSVSLHDGENLVRVPCVVLAS